MTERLNVYLNGRMAGTLDWDNALDVFSFRYLPAYLDADDAIPISRSLPLKDVPFNALESRTFFENLLPPEVVRRRLEKILHHDYRNTFAFLKELGGDCAGAISLYPDGIEPGKGEDVLRELTEDEADDVLTSLPTRPLLQGKVDGYRISVAGAQDKLVARLRGGVIHLPLYGAASTHIIKPQMAICADAVENECFCQRLARRLGLDAAKASVLDVKERTYYVSERYDRKPEGNSVRRILQEDFCQAMGVPSETKYESDGGASAVRCFLFLRNGGFGFSEMSKFIDALVFNFLIGNADAHAKNFSFLYDGGKAGLSPLYDLLSTAVYPNLSSRMAMSIGGAWEFAEVNLKSFDTFAVKCDVNPKFVRGRIDRMLSTLPTAMKDVAGELSDGGHHSPVFGQIIKLAQRHIDQLRLERNKVNEENVD